MCRTLIQNFAQKGAQDLISCALTLYQIRMILYRLLDPLWLDADISLRGIGNASLKVKISIDSQEKQKTRSREDLPWVLLF